MIRILTQNIILFFTVILLQLFVFNHIQLNGLIIPYFYILLLLLLPFDISKSMLLFVGFVLGIIIDIFSFTPGLHAAACTFAAAVRPTILEWFAPRDGYESGTLPRVSYFGLAWFIKYSFVLIMAHHIFLFFLEVSTFHGFFSTLFRALASSLFTLTLVTVSQFFIFRK